MQPPTPKGITFMRINKIEYLAPNQANKIGSVTFEVEVPVVFEEGQKVVNDAEDVQVELTPEIVNLLEQAAALIIKKLTE